MVYPDIIMAEVIVAHGQQGAVQTRQKEQGKHWSFDNRQISLKRWKVSRFHLELENQHGEFGAGKSEEFT